MPTYTLTGSGTQAVTSPGSLKVTVTDQPPGLGFGTANPVNLYGLGSIRLGTAHGYLPPVDIHAVSTLLPCPAGTTIFGYSLVPGAEITVEERAEQPYAGPTGPPGAAGATGPAGAAGATGGLVHGTLLLNYTAAADIASALTINQDTWTNFGPSHSFTITDAAALVAISVRCGMFSRNIGAGGLLGALYVDATTRYKVGLQDTLGTLGGNPWAGGQPVFLTGLSASAHTVQLQLWSRAAPSGNVYCRPGTVNSEFLSVQVVQL